MNKNLNEAANKEMNEAANLGAPNYSWDPEVVRAIATKHQASILSGVLVDAVTAHMLITVYDGLSPEYQHRFCTMNIRRSVRIGWQLVK